jgi:hypothetical protein
LYFLVDALLSATARQAEKRERSGTVYDALSLRNQRQIIRDVMIEAARSGSWLTLAELASLTQYKEPSVSAQLRHLRKTEYGGYVVEKRVRRPMIPEIGGGRRITVWEYAISKG